MWGSLTLAPITPSWMSIYVCTSPNRKYISTAQNDGQELAHGVVLPESRGALADVMSFIAVSVSLSIAPILPEEGGHVID